MFLSSFFFLLYSILSFPFVLLYQGTSVMNFVSSSKDPSKFVLSAYSLQINTAYQVQATASYQGSSSSVSIQINVISGALVPFIEGGADQVVRAGGLLVLDGSKSYDQNENTVVGNSPGLLYSWSCLQISPL
jgi:hypothetical protein